MLDDSTSYALTEDGWIEPPRPGHQDLYFFSYGYAYRQALADFFHLCGPTPLLPRYALGNWWSRFHAYTAEEYLSLMDRFEKSGIPLSVAVIDMNWHISSDGSDHKGWTGYTWDKALFPEPAAFLKALHQKGLRVTLNLHPAEGIQPHEVAYPQAAAALGRDAARGQRIPFEPENRAFWRVYFDLLHRPLERQGVASQSFSCTGCRARGQTGVYPVPIRGSGQSPLSGRFFGRQCDQLEVPAVSALFYGDCFQHWIRVVESRYRRAYAWQA